MIVFCDTPRPNPLSVLSNPCSSLFPALVHLCDYFTADLATDIPSNRRKRPTGSLFVPLIDCALAYPSFTLLCTSTPLSCFYLTKYRLFAQNVQPKSNACRFELPRRVETFLEPAVSTSDQRHIDLFEYSCGTTETVSYLSKRGATSNSRPCRAHHSSSSHCNLYFGRAQWIQHISTRLFECISGLSKVCTQVESPSGRNDVSRSEPKECDASVSWPVASPPHVPNDLRVLPNDAYMIGETNFVEKTVKRRASRAQTLEEPLMRTSLWTTTAIRRV